MSRWTHVSGIIRVDGIPAIGLVADIAAVLGRPSTRSYDGDTYDPGSDIPGGSEGTLQYEIIHAGDGLVWKTVAVWGDLRDFDTQDTPAIDAWFARIVGARAGKLMLRAAHLLVEVADDESYLLVLDNEGVRRLPLTPSTIPAGWDADRPAGTLPPTYFAVDAEVFQNRRGAKAQVVAEAINPTQAALICDALNAGRTPAGPSV